MTIVSTAYSCGAQLIARSVSEPRKTCITDALSLCGRWASCLLNISLLRRGVWAILLCTIWAAFVYLLYFDYFKRTSFKALSNCAIIWNIWSLGYFSSLRYFSEIWILQVVSRYFGYSAVFGCLFSLFLLYYFALFVCLCWSGVLFVYLSNKSWSVESCLIMQITEATAASRPVIDWTTSGVTEPMESYAIRSLHNACDWYCDAVTVWSCTVYHARSTKAPRLRGKSLSMKLGWQKWAFKFPFMTQMTLLI